MPNAVNLFNGVNLLNNRGGFDQRYSYSSGEISEQLLSVSAASVFILQIVEDVGCSLIIAKHELLSTC